MKYILSLMLLIVSFTTIEAETLSLKEIQEATCRVTADQRSIGSGTIVSYKDGLYYILTNGHVASGSRSVTVELFDEGWKTQKIPAKLVWDKYVNGTSIDMAVLTISETQLNGYKPRVIKLAPRETNISVKDYVFGSGCPAGRWLQAWQGRIINTSSDKFYTNMPPEGGQSGSGALTNIGDETYLIGIVTWRYNDGYGGCVNLDRIYASLDGNMSRTKVDYVFNDAVEVSYEEPIFLHAKDDKGRIFSAKTDKNGKRLIQNGINFVTPESIKVNIVEWGTECPDGNCPLCPKGRGGRGGNGGDDTMPIGGNSNGLWGDRPPIGNDNGNPAPTPDTTPKPNPQLEESKKKIADLEAKIAELNLEVQKYTTANGELSGQIKILEEKIAELNKQKDDLSKDVLSVSAVSNNLQGVNQALQEEKKGLLDKISDLGSKLGVAEGKIADLIEEAKKKDLDKKPTEEIKSIWSQFQNGEISLQNALLLIISAFITYYVGNWARKKFGTMFAKFLITIIENKLEEKFGKNETSEEIVKKKIETRVEAVYNNEEGTELNLQPSTSYGPTIASPPIPINNNTININGLSFKKVDGEDHATQFMKLKERDGESIEQWAFTGKLYQEAIGLLRSGKLYFSEDNPLQGQAKTADVIDDWVKTEFLKRATKEMLTQFSKYYHDAYIGFLFKEAVSELRKGTFNVLGAINTADAIDKYVRDKLFEKLGITI